jgi:hypothetical protein
MSATNSEYINPPTLNGTNTPTNTVTSSSSTAAVPIGGNGFYTFVGGGTEMWIVFGNADVAAATAANGLRMPADVAFTWKIEAAQQTHFRVIGTGAGTLSWYKSGP